jgi:branched-chain amino acid transport system substrate-binding protein
MRVKIFLLLIYVVIIVVGCGKKEPEIVQVGAILPLSGNSANIGKWQQQGIELALEQIKSKSKENKKTIQVLYEDSQGDPKSGLSAFQKLTTTKNLNIVVASLSSVASAILPQLDRNPKTTLMLAVSLPKITEKSKFAFRFNLGSDDEAIAMSKYLSDKEIKRIGVAYINDEFGVGALEVFQQEIRLTGGELLLAEAYTKDQTDFRTLVTKLVAKQPEAIYVIGYVRASVMLIRQIREMGNKTPVFGNMALSVPSYIEMGGSALDSAIFTVTRFDPDSKDEKVSEFVKAFVGKYSEKPTFFSAFSYDAIMVLQKVIDSTDNSSEAIRDGLLSIKEFEGVMGLISMQQNRDIKFQTRIVQNINGNIIPIH